jgi:4-hydroxymandelate oxidase
LSFDGKLRTVADYEHYCRQITSPAWYEFHYGEHGDPNWSTYTSNRAGFNALKLRPRVLTGVVEPRLATTLLGQPLSLPVIVGPTGLIHEDPLGEPATARAANNAGTLLALSSIPTMPVPEVAAAADRWWQQVFVYRDRAMTQWQVKNAIELGASAIVLTVTCTGDMTYHQILRFPTPAAGTYEPPSSFASYDGPGGRDPAGPGNQIDPGVSWADVDWLASLSELPLIVKGIQTAEDAELCLQHGVDGIVVSNHGGRFAQGVRGTIEALPEIVEAVGGRIEVSLDGGVRQGQDILKALALGARTVWIGRAARWGQTVEGQAGVEHVLDILRQELRGMMALCGVADVNAVDRALVTAEAIGTLEG